MKNNHHILYSFRRCPYAMRARLALTVARTPYEHREIVLRDKPQHMLEISPKGTVPVLLLNDGTVVDESLDVMLWALNQNDPEFWLETLESAMPLISENDSSFKKALDRYKYPNRYQSEEGYSDVDWRECGVQFLLKLEKLLQSSDFLYRSSMSMADAAIFPFVRQFANTDQDWWIGEGRLVKTREWLDRCIHSSLFLEVMKKYPLYNDGGEAIFCNMSS